MSATITDKFKRELLDGMYRSFSTAYDSGISLGDSDLYYVGISRAEEWEEDDNPPTPYPDKETVRIFQSSMQAVKRVTDLSYVVPRYNWSAGSIYTAWSDKNHSDTTVGAFADIAGPYYVITDDLNVYVCLQQGKTSEGVVRNSIYKPIDVSYDPFSAGPDGYLWKFLYNVGVYNSRRYLTSEWIPVEYVLDSSEGGLPGDELSSSRLAQIGVQQNAIPGQILGIEVEANGSGYDTAPTVIINGDNTSEAAAYAELDSNGAIFQVVMKENDSASLYSYGSGYGPETWITLSGGVSRTTPAKLRPVIHQDVGGLGFDPTKDLNASSLMYSVRLIADENKVFNISNDFRQLGLIKNPNKDSASFPLFTGDSEFTDVRGTALNKLYVGNGIIAENTTLDNTVTGLNSGAKALLDYYEEYVDSDCCDSLQNTTKNVLYVHQTPETGFTPFDRNEVVELSDNGGMATIQPHEDPAIPALRFADVDKFSGEVLYIDNRVQIERDPDQTEDVKIVIDL
jgi:hypothetical protein